MAVRATKSKMFPEEPFPDAIVVVRVLGVLIPPPSKASSQSLSTPSQSSVAPG